jgi:hypothetical protein
MSDLLESIATWGWLGESTGLQSISTYGWWLDFEIEPASKGLFVEMDGLFDEGVWF